MKRMQIAQGLIKLQDLHKKGYIDCKDEDAEDIGKAISSSIEIILRARGDELYGKDY
tara:strand:- start:852 stop:1022 length:171 start_codon:yes stop_codon:yes gene_type:complete